MKRMSYNVQLDKTPYSPTWHLCFWVYNGAR